MLERPSSQNELIGSQLLKLAEQKSESVLQKYRLDMKPFIELYTKEQVEADYKDVLLKIKSHEQTGTTAEKLGKIFESAFIDTVNNHHWLGENGEVVKASLYDDFHGIDMISTFVPEGKPAQSLVIGSDLTFSTKSVGSKFQKTLRGVCAGHLATVKYFHSELEGYTGRKSNVPRTVIGLDKQNLPEMIRLWVHDPENPLEEYRSLIIHQMYSQTSTLRDYLGKELGKNHKAFYAYDNATAIISDMRQKAIPFRELPKDTVTNEIFAAMDSIS